MKIRQSSIVALNLILLLTIPRVARADQFHATGNPRELKGAPGIYEWKFMAVVGKSPFDKIGLHRLAKGPKPPEHLDAVVLYLPGTNMNGEVALEDPKYSFQVYLAEHGVDVWAIDYRTHFIPATTPESDLAELKGWTNDLFESDIDAAAKFVSEKSGHGQLFVAGFSRGVEFAYLFAAKHYPERTAGIIALDGFIPTRPMRVVPAGHYADDIGGEHLTYDRRYKLMQMVIENPDQAAPIPKYKTARDNLEHVVYDAGGFFGGKGGLANPQGGFSDPVVLAKLLISYDRYWPAVQDGENPRRFRWSHLQALTSVRSGRRWRKRRQDRPARQIRHSRSSTDGGISTFWPERSPTAKSSRQRWPGSSSIRSRRNCRGLRTRRSGMAAGQDQHRGDRPRAECEAGECPSQGGASATRCDNRSEWRQR